MDGGWTDVKILAQASFALFLGGILGWERESAGKWAGIRTHMLVCLASFLFVKTGELMIHETTQRYTNGMIHADPTRILEAIMTGIAFIGAGTVFTDRDRNIARGLTTAASLLMVAPIGVAVAIERYVLASGTTLIVLFVLRVMFWIETRMRPEKKAVEDSEKKSNQK